MVAKASRNDGIVVLHDHDI